MTKVENVQRYVGAPIPAPAKKDGPFFVMFWRSAVGKKWIMAVTGIMLIGFVFAHMLGNLKIFLSADAIDHYAEWLRTIGYPILPETGVLWLLRLGLLSAVVLHIWAAASLTRMNRSARPNGYKSPRVRSRRFAARTMRWTGIILTLFIIFHLLDLTWGRTGADHVPGNVYQNIINSFTCTCCDRLHRCKHRYCHSPLSRCMVDVPEPRDQQPAIQSLAQGLCYWARINHWNREYQHSSASSNWSRQMSTINLDSKIPAGPLEDKWDNHKFSVKLVNPQTDASFAL